MRKFPKLISSVILFLATVIGALVFSGQAYAESSKASDTSFETIKGQLVISVEADSKNSMENIDGTIFSSASSVKLQEKGFQVKDSLLNSIQSESVQTLSQDFKIDVIDKMGLVYLIEYTESNYKNVDKAKAELEKTLNDLGLNVRYVQENYTMHAVEIAPEKISPTSMHPNQAWHYEMINAPEAWEITPDSSSTRIAVLDTGIDSTHPSLSDFVSTSLGKSFVGGDTGDRAGHGTHVAGTIASYGEVSGVMQHATLIPVKVLGDDGTGSMYGIQQGITYAASIDADVINMSLGGGGYFQGMEEAIETANSQGTIVVAASGNDGANNVSYPAAYSGSIAVGSVTSNKTRSSFSNYGSELDVMAPGSDIYSTLPNNQYDTLSGTSMASPHVAGVMGLIRATNPDISVDDARTILNNTAQDAGSELEYGHGIVDAYAAVQEATSGGDEDNDGNDGDNEKPSAPEWQAYTWYVPGEEVAYNGKTYVCQQTHYAFPGWEPPNTPRYWTEK